MNMVHSCRANFIWKFSFIYWEKDSIKTKRERIEIKKKNSLGTSSSFRISWVTVLSNHYFALRTLADLFLCKKELLINLKDLFSSERIQCLASCQKGWDTSLHHPERAQIHPTYCQALNIQWGGIHNLSKLGQEGDTSRSDSALGDKATLQRHLVHPRDCRWSQRQPRPSQQSLLEML